MANGGSICFTGDMGRKKTEDVTQALMFQT